MNNLDLSFVVVSWNTCDLLRNCLESIERTVPPLSYEILVVDNASSDGSLAMLRHEFPTVRLLANQQNLGFARANNQALSIAQGRYVVLLNPDAVLLAETVAQCVAFLDATPNAGVAGGELLNSDGSFQSGPFPFPTWWSEVRRLAGREAADYRKWKARYRSQPAVRSADWIGGAFMMLRRRMLIEVGLLDERFFMYAEELEWCYRIRRAGWQIYYLATAQVIHHQGQSTKQVAPEMIAQSMRSLLILFWTHYPRWQALVLTLLSGVVGLAYLGMSGWRPANSRALRTTGRLVLRACLEVPWQRRPQIVYLADQPASLAPKLHTA